MVFYAIRLTVGAHLVDVAGCFKKILFLFWLKAIRWDFSSNEVIRICLTDIWYIRKNKIEWEATNDQSLLIRLVLCGDVAKNLLIQNESEKNAEVHN